MMENNPVWFSDPLGDSTVFVGNSEQYYDRIYASASDSKKAELDLLRSSDIIYRLDVVADASNFYGKQEASTFYNFDDGVLEIMIMQGFSDGIILANLGDELTHGYQFETGAIGFAVDYAGDQAILGYDMQDEIDSKLGAVNAIISINRKEKTSYRLDEETSNFRDFYERYKATGQVSYMERYMDFYGYMEDFPSEGREGREPNQSIRPDSKEKSFYEGAVKNRYIKNYIYRTKEGDGYKSIQNETKRKRKKK